MGAGLLYGVKERVTCAQCSPFGVEVMPASENRSASTELSLEPTCNKGEANNHKSTLCADYELRVRSTSSRRSVLSHSRELRVDGSAFIQYVDREQSQRVYSTAHKRTERAHTCPKMPRTASELLPALCAALRLL